MSRSKSFALGIVVGSLLVGTATYASDSLQLSVRLPKLTFSVDGEIAAPNLNEEGQYIVGNKTYPLAIQYDGVNYVPIRFLTEALQAKTTYNPQKSEIAIETSENVPFEEVKKEQLSADMASWVERSLPRAMTQYRQEGGYTYILITQGRKSTGGYGIEIKHIRRYEHGATAHIQVSDPKKGELAITQIMFPYALVRVEGELKGPIVAKSDEGDLVPSLSGTSHIYQYYQESNDFLLFKPFLRGDQLIVNGIVRSFDGLVGFRLSGSEGHTLEEGTIRAFDSAPDWGYFSRSFPLSGLDSDMRAELWIYSGNESLKEQKMTLELSDWLP